MKTLVINTQYRENYAAHNEDFVEGPIANKNFPSKEKISRNAPCPCGSGKKYKHCCGKI